MARGKPDNRPALLNLATGVPGLDTVLGGGLPEYSFNLIVLLCHKRLALPMSV
ncbi:MAG: hypothetical protein ACREV5_20960 [Steroidobacter sp.]